VDLGRQVLADLAGPMHAAVVETFKSGYAVRFRKAADAFLELIGDLDRLLATQRRFLLGRWLADARRWGRTPQEKSLYERNARMLITIWGPVHPEALLFDYSNRQWSGLVSGFYLPRWRMFLDFLAETLARGRAYDEANLRRIYNRPANDATDFYARLAQWELRWCHSRRRYRCEPTGDPLKVSRELFEKYCPHLPARDG